MWLNDRMPDKLATRRSSRAKITRKRLIVRWVVWSLVGILVVVLALGAWIGFRAFQAKAELEAAQGLIGELKTQALAFDIDGASATLKKISTRTDNAIELTTDPIWMAGEVVPFAGPNLTGFRELAAVTGDVIDDVVTPLIGVAKGIDPASLAPKDGAIDLEPLIAAVPAIATANDGAIAALKNAEAIDTSATIEQISAARTQITGLIGSVTPLLATLNSIVPLVPPAMGSEAPRTYVIMFQNPAESRALGGTALSFALLKMDAGRIELQATVAAGLDNFRGYNEPVVAMPDGTIDLYADTYARFIANVTVRPSFTTAAEITQEMWFRQFGYRVDGIISIDPVALSYVLGATDPITLSTGDILTRESLVPLLLNGVYQRFNSTNVVKDNIAQDVVYAEAVGATFARLTSGPLDPMALINALMQGWNEHRVLYWSANADEQAQLAEIGLNGELPISDDKTERIGVYFQDNVGSKMNYYLQQTVHLAQNTCRTDGRESYRVTVDLGNGIDPTLAKSLSASIVGQWKPEKVKRGDQRMIVMLYAPPGTTIASKTINGAPAAMDAFHDTTYPVSKTVVTIPAGAVSTVSFDVVAPEPGTKTLEALITPMVNPTTVLNEVLDCATVPAG